MMQQFVPIFAEVQRSEEKTEDLDCIWENFKSQINVPTGWIDDDDDEDSDFMGEVLAFSLGRRLAEPQHPVRDPLPS